MGLNRKSVIAIILFILAIIGSILFAVSNRKQITVSFPSTLDLQKNYIMFFNNHSVYFFDFEKNIFLNQNANFLLKDDDEKILNIKKKENNLYFLTWNISSRKSFLYQYNLNNKKINEFKISPGMRNLFIFSNFLILPQSVLYKDYHTKLLIIDTSENNKGKELDIRGFAQYMHTVFNNHLIFYKTTEYDKGNIVAINENLTYFDLFKEDIFLIDYTNIFSDENYLYFTGKNGIKIFDKNFKKIKEFTNKIIIKELPGLVYFSVHNSEKIYFFEIRDDMCCWIKGINKKTLDLFLDIQIPEYIIKNVFINKDDIFIIVAENEEFRPEYFIDRYKIPDNSLQFIERQKINIDFKRTSLF